MNKIAPSLILTLLTLFAFGQIDNNLKKANWSPGKEKIIFGNTILKHEGKNGIRGITNVGFQTLAQLILELENTAEKEMWTPEKKKETIELYEKLAPGGMIHLYITRLTIGSANTNMFTVIVKDSADIEVFRKDLDSDIPNTPSSGSDYWWNYSIIPIPQIISGMTIPDHSAPPIPEQ